MASGRSTASILAFLFAGLVLYASLYPFEGWVFRGQAPWAWLREPWPRYWTAFDVMANLVGYVPLGLLIGLAQIRNRWPAWSWPLTALLPVVLSLGVETLQVYLPMRVPSRLDLVLNATGGLLGVLMAGLLALTGTERRWDAMRLRWFDPQARGSLVLLALWPFALLYPAPVPFGLGQVAMRLSEQMDRLLADTPFQSWLTAGPSPLPPLGPLTQSLCVMLGLLAPLLLAYGDMPSRVRRFWLMLALIGTGLVVSGLSAALTWGPDHAWSWISAPLWLGVLLAMTGGLAAVFLPRRLCAALLLLTLGVLLAVLNRAPDSPYLAESLELWEQGRFIRFHGLSQWLGWLWPYAALVYGAAMIFRRTDQARHPSRN